jgi:DNA-binding transcriptional LysR family regulator
MTPDMQNRRIIESLLRTAGALPEPVLESNSVIVLIAHVRCGRWSTILPERTVRTMVRDDSLCAVPIVDPIIVHSIGLVVPDRDPPAPLAAALIAEARRIAEAGLSGEPPP